ncbi:MAG TPA: methionyl-tRNA formyltransferase [Desulfomonilaceae bacterium]|nr:methionyl-tRNA formyltransferase [Desulfomonilaceae bacterium]
MNLNIGFMGSPDFAVPTLAALHEHFRVVGVVTQRDKPKGRGRKIVSTPVKEIALKLKLPVVEPDTFDEAFMDILREWKPDVLVVAAFGKILPRSVLHFPRLGCINLHGSLLPRHRGASPISTAILVGDSVTGVCTMLMDEGMDTGAVLLQREIVIAKDDTAGSLHDKLMKPGADLVVETLRRIAEGNISPIPQDASRATYTDLLTRKSGRLTWDRGAVHLDRLVKAMNPWPAAFFVLSGEYIKVWGASSIPGTGTPGIISSLGSDGFEVGTTRGRLLIREVQAPGKKRISAGQFARSRRLREGDVLE